MGHRDIHSLESALNTETSRVHRARVFDPHPRVLNAAYITRNTVEPLSDTRVKDQIYSVRIKKARIEWHKGEFEEGLIVSLLEKSVNDVSSTLLEVPFSLPKRQDTNWVNMVASLLEDEYEQFQIGAYDKIPETGMLRQLIAGRVEFYMRGGSAQNLQN